MDRYDVVVGGGGIIGLATARALRERFPGASVAVLEQERAWAAHQTGHNSGVIHSGIYYTPGSLKARLCRAGSAGMVAFCRAEGVPVEVCGKLIVATGPQELPRLQALLERGVANGLQVRRVGPEELREREPHVRALAAVHVPGTAVVDFRQVCQALVRQLGAAGVELRLGAGVRGIERADGGHALDTAAGEVRAGWLVNCAGAQSDRLARAAGADPGARIVPFRGEYYELAEPRRSLVRGLAGLVAAGPPLLARGGTGDLALAVQARVRRRGAPHAPRGRPRRPRAGRCRRARPGPGPPRPPGRRPPDRRRRPRHPRLPRPLARRHRLPRDRQARRRPPPRGSGPGNPDRS